MKKLNNKGFTVSAILYALLIGFLLFLLAALAMFSSSNTLISGCNDDIKRDTTKYDMGREINVS